MTAELTTTVHSVGMENGVAFWLIGIPHMSQWLSLSVCLRIMLFRQRDITVMVNYGSGLEQHGESRVNSLRMVRALIHLKVIAVKHYEQSTSMSHGLRISL
jgi:hypothetical protein